MSSSLIRRRPRRAALLGAVVAISLLAGCTGQRDPGGYSDGVRRDFIAGCDGSAFAATDADRVDAEEMKDDALPTAQCECIYDIIEDTIDFGDFSKANSERRDDPSALDEPMFTEAFEACGPEGLLEGETAPPTEGPSDATTSTTEG